MKPLSMANVEGLLLPWSLKEAFLSCLAELSDSLTAKKTAASEAGHTLLDSGRPGYDLADYGIHPRALPTYSDSKAIGPHFPQPNAGLWGVAQPNPQSQHTMTADSGIHRPWAGLGFQGANELNAFNHQVQVRIRRGRPALDSEDSGS